jgi:hypothetical protein
MYDVKVEAGTYILRREGNNLFLLAEFQEPVFQLDIFCGVAICYTKVFVHMWGGILHGFLH